METREVDGIGFTCGSWPLDSSRSSLIFVHGSGGSSVLWQEQVDALAPRASTIALDLPGRGLSRGPGMRTIPDHASIVLEFVEALEASRPIPCGQSLGGGIALQLLLDHPGRFEAAILIGSGARLRVMPAILEGIERDYRAHLTGLHQAASPRTDRKALEPLLEAYTRCAAEVALGDFMACDAFDVMDRLGEIEVPVLVVCGDDDALTPPKYADFLEKNIRNARRAQLADAGHLAPVEKPAEINRAITDFLDATDL